MATKNDAPAPFSESSPYPIMKIIWGANVIIVTIATTLGQGPAYVFMWSDKKLSLILSPNVYAVIRNLLLLALANLF
jgi:hypothetical protein